jgi:hypothetical protein
MSGFQVGSESTDPGLPSRLPFRLEQSSARTSPILLIGVLVPVVSAMIWPFALIAEQLAADPAARAFVATRPETVFQLVTAFAFCAALFGWPLANCARALASKRTITIDGLTVRVVERGLLGTSNWVEPIARYSGIAHRVRASLSGLRHEITLVHPNDNCSVLLAVAPQISQEEFEHLARLLNLAEISSRDAFSVSLTGGLLGPAVPQPRIGAVRA